MRKSVIPPFKPTILILLVILFLPWFLRAQDEFEDPPTRVARLSFIRGSISFQPAGTEDWVDATLNRPVTTLWSDRGSTAALHTGSASIVQPTQRAVDLMHDNSIARNYMAPKPAKLQRDGAETYGFYYDAPIAKPA